MKIYFTKEVLGEITTFSYLAVQGIALKAVAKELKAGLQASVLNPNNRVLAFVQNAKIEVMVSETRHTATLESEYLRRLIGPSVYQTCRACTQLAAVRPITVVHNPPLRIKYSIPLPKQAVPQVKVV